MLDCVWCCAQVHCIVLASVGPSVLGAIILRVFSLKASLESPEFLDCLA